MASPYGHYAEILEDILKELQKRKRRKNPPNRFHYRINLEVTVGCWEWRMD